MNMKNALMVVAVSAVTLSAFAQIPCVGGMAGEYPCLNIDLMAVMPLADVGGGDNGNDCWGWVGPTGREYAIYGRSNGTAFIEITDPANPIYLGNLPSHSTSSLWRDIKVFSDHAFIVAEAGSHGMQVFDLMQLESVEEAPVLFAETAHYDLFGNAHNIAINEETGFAYAVGTSTFNGGLHIVDISNPTNPVIAGDFALDGYTHDAQIVIYNGPDQNYAGREIAFAANENTVTIVDCTQKLNCTFLSTISYDDVGYIHQGWLTEDQRYFLVNDELDEITFGNNTRTYIFDVQNLEEPQFVGFYEGHLPASDHNLYVKDNLCYQANYRSGLRVLNIAGVASGSLFETGFFDTNPLNNNAGFWGAWSNYPYFPSGNVIISTFSHFFVVRPTEDIVGIPETTVDESGEWFFYPNPATDYLTVRTATAFTGEPGLIIFDFSGRQVHVDVLRHADTHAVTYDVSHLKRGMYVVSVPGRKGARILVKD